MKNSILTTTILLSVSLAACNSGTTLSEKDPKDSSQAREIARDPAKDSLSKASAATSENDFATKAAIGGMTELESSAKMLKLTENPDVQTLATVMVKDHGQANKELMRIAQAEGIVLPKTLPQEKLDVIKKIESLKDDEFLQNLTYVNFMVNEHRTAVQLFTEGAKSENKALATFAAQKLPTLKHHLMETINVYDILKKIKNDKGDLPLKESKDRKN